MRTISSTLPITTSKDRSNTVPQDDTQSLSVKAKRKVALPLLFLAFAISPLAQAEDSRVGLFLEPSLTYETADTTVNYPSPFANSTGKADGFGLGARIGVHVHEAFFLGFDGRYSMPQFKDSSVGYDAKSVATNWGPVVGMQMPDIGLRIWGSYVMGGELNPDRSGSFDIKFQNAKGYRVGAGFRLAAISLNLEYQYIKYDQTSLEQFGPFSPNSPLGGVQLENKTWIASVSFPLEL